MGNDILSYLALLNCLIHLSLPTVLGVLVLLLQTAPELLQEDFHGQGEVELLVVQPVDSERDWLLAVRRTQRGDGGKQGDIWEEEMINNVIRIKLV